MIIENFSLDGKVALVTGGGTGLGRAIALVLAEAGADIALTARRIGPLEETATIIKNMGKKAFPVTADITISTQVDSMVQTVLSKLGKIDILINNAGAATQFMNLPVTEITDNAWREGMDIDLTGAFYCSRAVTKEMIKRGEGGKIVSVSSMSGIVGLPASPIYGIAKAGVINMTRLFAMALAPYKINVNCIVAGAFRTRAIGEDYQDEEAIKKRGRFVPVGRLGNPEEMGPLALLLSSPASNYITGQSFLIDGGTYISRYVPPGFSIPEKVLEYEGL